MFLLRIVISIAFWWHFCVSRVRACIPIVRKISSDLYIPSLLRSKYRRRHKSFKLILEDFFREVFVDRNVLTHFFSNNSTNVCNLEFAHFDSDIMAKLHFKNSHLFVFYKEFCKFRNGVIIWFVNLEGLKIAKKYVPKS